MTTWIVAVTSVSAGPTCKLKFLRWRRRALRLWWGPPAAFPTCCVVNSSVSFAHTGRFIQHRSARCLALTSRDVSLVFLEQCRGAAWWWNPCVSTDSLNLLLRCRPGWRFASLTRHCSEALEEWSGMTFWMQHISHAAVASNLLMDTLSLFFCIELKLFILGLHAASFECCLRNAWCSHRRLGDECKEKTQMLQHKILCKMGLLEVKTSFWT